MIDQEELYVIIKQITDGKFKKLRDYELEYIAKYYEYLSNELPLKINRIKIETKLTNIFEVVFIYLKQLLEASPIAIQTQVSNIENQYKLCEFFMQLGAHIQSKFQDVMDAIGLGTKIFNLTLPISTVTKDESYNSKNIYSVKTALNRLSQMVDYSRTQSREEKYHMPHIEDFEEHFDTELLNGTMFLLYFEELRKEIIRLPNNDSNKLILKKIDEVKEEIKKGKPSNWANIIIWSFMIFGAIGDLKSIAPETYDKAHKITQAIVSELYSQPQKNKNRKSLYDYSDNGSKSDKNIPIKLNFPEQNALLPEVNALKLENSKNTNDS